MWIHIIKTIEKPLTKMNVRAATLEDLPTLLKLEQGIIDAERPFDQYIKQEGATYYDIPNLIVDSNSYLIVMESGFELLGCGYAQIRQSKSCYTHDKHCYLGFIYLDPEHRGKALGHVLIDELKRWGLDKGMQHFKLDVFTKNEAAIRAYEKAGFFSVSVNMELVV